MGATPRAFLTQYRSGSSRYGSELWARSWADADRKARARGLREKVIGRDVLMTAPPPSVILRSRRPFADKVHALCFLGLIACAARVATPRDFFDDETGVLHRLIHHAAFKGGPDRPPMASILRRVRAIERAVPGLLPPRRVRRGWRGAAKPGQTTFETRYRERPA